jgi:anti-sigma factor RsiW
MKNPCVQWKDQLLEAALGAAMGTKLEAHLAQCAHCADELGRLRARRERLDIMLPLIAAAEPRPELSARILATEATNAHRYAIGWRQWAAAAAATGIVMAVMLGRILSQRASQSDLELKRAQELAQWRAPTDVLLRLPGRHFLNTPPKLGESYLTLPGTRKGEK